MLAIDELGERYDSSGRAGQREVKPGDPLLRHADESLALVTGLGVLDFPILAAEACHDVGLAGLRDLRRILGRFRSAGGRRGRRPLELISDLVQVDLDDRSLLVENGVELLRIGVDDAVGVAEHLGARETGGHVDAELVRFDEERNGEGPVGLACRLGARREVNLSFEARKREPARRSAPSVGFLDHRLDLAARAERQDERPTHHTTDEYRLCHDDQSRSCLPATSVARLARTD